MMVGVPSWTHEYAGYVVLYDAYGAMLAFSSWVRQRGNIRDLKQLQAALEGGGCANPSPEKQEQFFVLVLLSKRFYGFRVPMNGFLNPTRDQCELLF